MWQSSEYALGCSYRRFLNIPRFQVCQVSAHASITPGSEYGWIQLNNALWQGSEYAWSQSHRVLNKPPVVNMHWAQNMASLWICEGYNKNTECWICPNKPDYALAMSQHVWICLSNAQYDWICRHMTIYKYIYNIYNIYIYMYIYICNNIYIYITITEQLGEGEVCRIRAF